VDRKVGVLARGQRETLGRDTEKRCSPGARGKPREETLKLRCSPGARGKPRKRQKKVEMLIYLIAQRDWSYWNYVELVITKWK
jgi:hypothetical protein